MNREFEKCIAGYSLAERKTLSGLRMLVLKTAKETPGVGKLEEALQWGQHSFLTSETGSGSTIRIDAAKSAPGTCAIYFHCQPGLIETFKELYGKELTYEGKRALLFRAGKPYPSEAVSHCIALALTHHLRKKTVEKRQDKNDPSHHYRHRPRPG